MIADHLDIAKGSVVAVVGCGGKTSLIALLAKRLQPYKVLISPTTKMFPMQTEGDTDCLGRLNAVSGKLEALPESELAALVPQYDVVLLEADGSAGLPCKGWLDNEPVIPPYCTHTVGIITLNALGKPATDTIVLRLSKFLELTGLTEGAPITMQALETMVCAPRGMFKNSVGRRYLLVNQAEDDATAYAAQSFLAVIKEKYPNRFERLLFGSVRLDNWQEV